MSNCKEILNQPLPELGHHSWVRSFSDSLTEAKEKLEKLGIVPKLVLMTGGASRMKFTHLLCQEMFPEPEPERCIAMGLARVGRWDLRAAAFQQEVNKLFTSNKLKVLLKRHILELIESLTKPLTDGLIVNAVKAGLKDWQKNKIRTLADLEISLISWAE